MSNLSYGIKATSTLGVNRNCFHVMKTQSKDKFDYIASINQDFSVSYPIYLKRLETLEYLNDIIRYYIRDNNMQDFFSNILYTKGIYGSKTAYSCTTLIARQMDMRKMKVMVSVIKIFIENRRIFRSFISYLRNNYEIREVMKSYKFFLEAYGDADAK